MSGRNGPLAAASRGTVALLVLASAVRAVGTVLLAEGVARGVAAVAAGTGDWRLAVLAGGLGALLRAAAVWAGTAVGAATGAELAGGLRLRIGARALGPGAPDDAVLLGAHRLDDLQRYCTTVLPALVDAAVVPLVLGTRILLADAVSGVILACTLPLVPVFMALVGLHTQDRVEAATAALERLAAHLLELARGLPVLVGLGRIDEQAAVLRRLADEHRRRTMATLRVAFLSSLVLELVATISVAVVAVVIGIRLLSGDLPLWAGLLALVLAPECFSALRDVGAAFHAGDAGLAAYDRARALLDAPAAEVPVRTGDAALDGLIVRHPDREPAIAGLDLRPVPLGITAVVGPSGSGKSTVLAAFAGLLVRRGAVVTGTVTVPPGGAAYLPQHPTATADTLLAELRLYGPLLTDARLRGLLGLVGLEAVAGEDPGRLSPGELRRLGVARVAARVESGADLVLLDEPTASLDPAHRTAVEQLIAGLRGRATVVLATHESSTLRLADAVVRLGGASATPTAEAEATDAAVGTPATAAVPDPVRRAGLGGIGALLRPVRGRLLGSVALGTATAAAAAALTAVSGWLIVRAAEHPPILLLGVAIVGVRFFGLARAALRYAERLTTHDAVLRMAALLRDRLWRGLAAHGARSRKLLNGATALELLVVTVDQVRDLVPRVLLPPAVAVVVAVAACTTTALLVPAAAAVVVAGTLIAFVAAPAAALLLDGRAESRAVTVRAALARRFAAIVAAADDLAGNGVGGAALAVVEDLDERLVRLDRRGAMARGVAGALVVLGSAVAALGALAAGAGASAPAPLVGVVVLLPLALPEAALALVDAARRAPALAAAWTRLRPVLRRPAPAGVVDLDGPLQVAVLDGVAARWTEEGPAVFHHVDATLLPGRWLRIEGPSGSGKSTLLSVLLGSLSPSAGRYLLDGVDAADAGPAAVARQVAWLPQDAHVFDSSVRRNLLLGAPGAPDAALWDVLDRVGLAALVRSHPLGLDMRVGAGGRALSGGQRARLALARTLLSPARLVLLDEPTAHLDAETAAAVMGELRRQLADRAVVLVSHRRDDAEVGDDVVTLGAPSVLRS
ncbi:thiol reductant ABC exporter subunit CydC [Amnibacterium kyonggiense]|uniref:ATP-binding cassette subfamily C protein CydCD n=1 Tax=Amnibacterium kyonggiense TaxID=595671 RepID=A0A4R7FKH5_9MICO|nr:thiol reductant ABC exporter subunit CydC [Amnibacterium kyonggiense]TDS76860.1 ATP-binding cassette subfamily C protein CydCD [Amnibacterium kyonggiense]